MGRGAVPGPICSESCPLGTGEEGLMCLAPSSEPGPLQASGIKSWPTVDKIGSAIRRAIPRVPGDAAGKLGELLSPTTLGLLAVALAIWAASHAVGIGEAIDLLLFVTGCIFIGWEAIEGVNHVIAFVQLSVGAASEQDLDAAGDHLAKAIAIIGVDTVIALLTRGAAKTWKGRYRPTVTGDPTLPAGTGWTNKYGDITYSTAGTAKDRALALFHEQVHSFLSPKIQPLRKLRADLGQSSYNNSELLRYTEEALAEGYSQLRVNGVKGLPVGIKFPITNGYVTLSGVLREAKIVGIVFLGTITVSGLTIYVYFELTE